MEGSVYTPGAGHSPRVLAGRDVPMRDWHLMLSDVAASGRVRRSTLSWWACAVGKTATVSAFAALSRDQGFEVINLQAVTGQAGLVQSFSPKLEPGWPRTQLRGDARKPSSTGSPAWTSAWLASGRDSRYGIARRRQDRPTPAPSQPPSTRWPSRSAGMARSAAS
ncbi:MAG: hypothetical protein LCH87_02980 [Actinobacteria bacterium]|nr:hypothetical protein [Actinomycetota bacterium]